MFNKGKSLQNLVVFKFGLKSCQKSLAAIIFRKERSIEALLVASTTKCSILLIKNYVFRIPIGITRMGGLLCCSSKNKSWNTEVLRENGAEVELAGVTWDLGIPEKR